MRLDVAPPCVLKVLICALLLFVCGAAPTSAHTQGFTGRVTDAEGAPVASATVRASSASGFQRATVTGADGRYLLTTSGQGGGTYELRVERIGFNPLTVVVELGTGTTPTERDIRLSRRVIELAGLEVRGTRPPQRPPQTPTPGGNEEAVRSMILDPYPVAPGDLGEIAAYKAGVVPLGADPDGLPQVSIAGQHPSQNSLTLDGATFGTSSIPAEALRSTAVVTSTFDPSRGQFSGGQIAATTRSGTDLFGGAFRFRFDHPALQRGTGDTPGRLPYTTVEGSGGAGGALVRGRLFWYAAGQGTHRTSSTATLEGTDVRTLAGLGLNPDSAQRFQALATQLGVATSARAERATDRASGLLRMDFHAAENHTATVRLDARGTRVTGLGSSPFALGASTNELQSTAGGVLAQVASYMGSVRNELRFYASDDNRRTVRAQAGPAGLVQISSELEDGTAGAATLRFGTSPFAFPDARTSLLELSNELLVNFKGGAHRAKLGFLLNREQTREEGGADTRGTFTFRSLEDFAAGRPTSFTRTLGTQTREATAEHLALFGGHFWHATRGLWIIQGARLEGTRYLGAPPLDADVASAFPDYWPAPEHEWGISPRAGFTYESRDRRWVLRGGVGEFRGRLPISALAGAFSERGFSSAETQLVCLGPAAPTPDWDGYELNPNATPTSCAGGTQDFASRTPAVTIFAPRFETPRTWHASLGGSHDVLRTSALQGSVYFDASWIRGLGQPVALDRNLRADLTFMLPREGGRLVYAPLEGIDPESGVVAPGAARLDPRYGIVRELTSRGRSTVAQLTVGTSILTRRLDILSVYYTHTRANDAVGSVAAPGGFSTPVAAARLDGFVNSASDVERRHMLQLHAIHPFGRWIEAGILARVTSGEPFTPLVDGDVNGDGLSNDPAFVFGADPTLNPELASGMARLLATENRATRDCLRNQLGRIAGRNSCHAPWSASLDLQANIRPPRGSSWRRFSATIAAGNVLGGVDRLLHGETGLRGWGDPAGVDPVLLQVRGFDPTSRAFLYDVNPSFGAQVGTRNTSRTPFTLTIRGRITVGSDPAQQSFQALVNSIRARGRSAAQLREQLAGRIPNLPLQVLGLNDSLGLALSESQRTRLQAEGDSLGARFGPLSDSLAVALSSAETGKDPAQVRQAWEHVRKLVDQAQTELDATIAMLRAVLTDDQWNRLPAAVRDPSRQLLPQRAITAGGAETW